MVLPWYFLTRVARSRDASDRCCRERNVLETPNLVERLHTPRAIMRSSFKANKDGVRRPVSLTSAVTRPVRPTAETETASYLLNGKTYELQNGTPVEHALLTVTLWSWVLTSRRGHTVSAAPGGHAACFNRFDYIVSYGQTDTRPASVTKTCRRRATSETNVYSSPSDTRH